MERQRSAHMILTTETLRRKMFIVLPRKRQTRNLAICERLAKTGKPSYPRSGKVHKLCGLWSAEVLCFSAPVLCFRHDRSSSNLIEALWNAVESGINFLLDIMLY